MRNFDYIQSLGLTDLHRYCSAIERMPYSIGARQLGNVAEENENYG
jgi:hypothetical protein